MPQKLIEAYDTRTGAKLPQRVPENWTRIFDHVSATPRQRATTAAGLSDDVPEADSPEDVDSTPQDVPEADSPVDVDPTPKTARRGRQTPVKES